MDQFSAQIEIIGVNSFVFVPEDILQRIFEQAGRNKGTIPIKGTINESPYRQTLVRYDGDWRYLARLKNPETLEKNIHRAVNFLLGKERFIGRDKP